MILAMNTWMESPVAVVILLITVATSIMGFQNPELQHKLMMRPYDVLKRGEWYRVLSCSLAHGSWMHLFFNALTFCFLGIMTGMEPALGSLQFLILYVGSLIFSAIPSLLRYGDNPVYQSLGASGAVSGIVMAYVMIMPEADLNLMFIPIDIPAWFVGLAYIIFSFVASLRGLGNIAHDAHLFGALGGIIFLVLMRPVIAERFIIWLQGMVT